MLAVLTPRDELTLAKIRLDKLLVDRGLTPSRERAQALILAGKVLVNEQKIEKAGALIDSGSGSVLRLLGEDLRYVSRGGLKLERALEHWHIDLGGKVCLDVGASTGGFSDCMLQHGAAKVIAVDTGYGQMDFGLRNDPRIRLLEKTNARYLEPGDVGEPVGFISMDVSFISATLVLPAVLAADKIGNLICGWMIHSKDGSPMKMAPHPALANAKVCYVGDPVAVVIAETLAQARDAAEKVRSTTPYCLRLPIWQRHKEPGSANPRCGGQ